MGHVETSLLMFTGLEINCVLKKAILLIATDLKIIVEANFPNANADNCINYNCIGITISETTVAFLRQEKKRKGYIYLSFTSEPGGLLRLSRAFSATLTGIFGMGAERLVLTQHSPYL
jgi:hypothetical protein